MLKVATNPTTKTGQGAGTHYILDGKGKRRLVDAAGRRVDNQARATVAGSKKLLTNVLASLRRKIAIGLGLPVPRTGAERIGSEKFVINELKWSHSDWLKVDTKAKAQSGAAVVRPQLPAKVIVSTEDRKWFKALQGPKVARGEGVIANERTQSSKHGSQNIWKTTSEFIDSLNKNGRACVGCDNEFVPGSYLFIDGDYLRNKAEQGHVEKTRKEGGTKEHVVPICPACQKIQGNGKGMSILDFQKLCRDTFEKRGYRHVISLQEAA